MIDRVAKTNNEMVLARIAFSKLLTRHSWDLLLHLLLYHLEMYYQYQLGLPYPPQLSPNSTPRACFSNFGYQLENPQNPIRCLIGFGLYEKKGKRIFWTSYLVPFITKSCNGGINFSFMWRMWISFLVPMIPLCHKVLVTFSCLTHFRLLPYLRTKTF